MGGIIDYEHIPPKPVSKAVCSQVLFCEIAMAWIC